MNTDIKIGDLFKPFTAWFSKDIPSDIKLMWRQYGGTTHSTYTTAYFWFVNDPYQVDSYRVITSNDGNYVFAIDYKWINHCLEDETLHECSAFIINRDDVKENKDIYLKNLELEKQQEQTYYSLSSSHDDIHDVDDSANSTELFSFSLPYTPFASSRLLSLKSKYSNPKVHIVNNNINIDINEFSYTNYRMIINETDTITDLKDNIMTSSLQDLQLNNINNTDNNDNNDINNEINNDSNNNNDDLIQRKEKFWETDEIFDISGNTNDPFSPSKSPLPPSPLSQSLLSPVPPPPLSPLPIQNTSIPSTTDNIDNVNNNNNKIISNETSRLNTKNINIQNQLYEDDDYMNRWISVKNKPSKHFEDPADPISQDEPAATASNNKNSSTNLENSTIKKINNINNNNIYINHQIEQKKIISPPASPQKSKSININATTSSTSSITTVVTSPSKRAMTPNRVKKPPTKDTEIIDLD